MRRIKNSVKAIIISLVAAVCVAAIVLGCVFGLKHDKPTPNNPNDTTDYSSLVKDVNSASEKASYDLLDTAPYASVAGCTTETLTDLGENYFVFKGTDSNQHFYTYTGDGTTDKPYVCKELTAKVAGGGFIDDDINKWRLSYNDKYLTISQDSSSEEETDQVVIDKTKVVYFGDETPELVFETQSLLTESIQYGNNIFGYAEMLNFDNGEELFSHMDVVFKVVRLSDTSEKSVLLYSKEFQNVELASLNYYFKVCDDFFVIGFGKQFFYGSFVNDEIKTSEITLENSDNLSYTFGLDKLSKDKYFIRIQKTYDVGDDYPENIIFTSGEACVYSYYIFDAKNQKLDSYVLKSGYGKASVELISDTASSYYIYEQKVENHNFVQAYLNSYYFGGNVLSYTSTIPEKIKVMNSSNVLLSSGLYSISSDALSVKEDYSNLEGFYIRDVFNDSQLYIYSKDGKYGIKDLNGSDIIKVPSSYIQNFYFDDMIAISKEKVLAHCPVGEEDYEGYYLIDLRTGNFEKFNDVEINENFKKLSALGLGLYLTKTGESYNLNVIGKDTHEVSDINSFSYSKSMKKGGLVVLKTNAGDHFLSLKQNFTISFDTSAQTNAIVSSDNNYISPYTKYSTEVQIYYGDDNIGKMNVNTIDEWGAWWHHNEELIVILDYGYYIKDFDIELDFSGCYRFKFMSSISVNTDKSLTYTNNGSKWVDETNTESWEVTIEIIEENNNKKVKYRLYMADNYYTVAADLDFNSNTYPDFKVTVSDDQIGKAEYKKTFKLSQEEGYKEYQVITYYFGNTTCSLPSPDPERIGYKFEGWYDEKNNGAKCTESYIAREGDEEFIVHWTANVYEVHFELDGGKGPSVTKVAFNADLSVSHPTKPGYTFNYWKISGMSTNCKKVPDTLYDDRSTSTNTYGNDIQIRNTTFKYLNSSSGTVTFTAVWIADKIDIKFIFLVSNNDKFRARTIDVNTNSSNEYVDIGDGISLSGYSLDKGDADYSYTDKGVLTVSKEVLDTSLRDIFMVDASGRDKFFTNSNGFSYKALYRDPGSGAYTKMPVLNTAYQLDGWIYKNVNSDSWYKVDTDNGYALRNVVNLETGGSGGGTETSPQAKTFTVPIYAIYKQRTYNVNMEWGNFGGSTLNDTNADLNNSFYDNTTEKYLNLQYSLDYKQISNNQIVNKDGGESSSRNVVTTNNYDVLNSSDAIFTFRTLQPSYIIDFIELRDFPYRDGSNYYKTTVYIDIIWGNVITFNLYWGDRHTALVEETTDIGDERLHYYYVTSSSMSDKINGISISAYRDADSNSPNMGTFVVRLTIAKVGYACEDSYKGKLNQDSVNGSGTYGFVVAPMVTSNFYYADTILGGSTDIAPGGVISGNDLYGLTEYYAVPVDSGSNFWIGGKIYKLSSRNSGYYILNNGDTIRVESSKIDREDLVYYDGKYVYYTTSQKVNYGNTQIIAISPEQSIFKSSRNSTFISSNDYFELRNYISSIKIKEVNFALNVPTRDLKSDAGKFVYDKLMFTAISQTGEIVPLEINSDDSKISYFGKTYVKTCAYILRFAQNGTSFEYRLYIAYCEDDNHVMYFLFSECNLPSTDYGKRTNDIVVEFTDFDFTVTISKSNYDSSSDDTGYGINILYSSDSSYSEDITEESNDEPSVMGILPQETHLFAFRPLSGYLINKLKVYIGDTLLYDFTLDKQNIGANFINSAEGSSFYLYRTTLTSSVSSTNVLIKYNYECYKNLEGFRTSTSTNSFNGTNWGIYFSNQFTPGSNTSLWGNVSLDSSGFESLYLLVSGIYDDVNIEVETISYFEFDFLDPNNLLGFDKALEGDYSDLRFSLLKDIEGFGLQEIEMSTLFNGEDIILKKLPVSDTENLYRFIFFGVFSDFSSKFAFFSSDLEYSNYFNNIRFYASSNMLESEHVYSEDLAGMPISRNIVFKDNYTELIYFETGDNLASFFTQYRDLEHYQYTDTQFVYNFKYQVMMYVSKNNMSISTNSYLSNSDELRDSLGSSPTTYYSALVGDNGVISDTDEGRSSSSFTTVTNGNVNEKSFADTSAFYQLDNPNSKINSWFNDTILTNINYRYNNDISNSTSKRAETEEFNTNWQNIYQNGRLNNISGYEIELTYYAIPGYYLQYIEIYTSKTGYFIIQNNGGNFNGGNRIVLKKSITDTDRTVDCNLTYRVIYDYVEGCYHIYLYDNGEDGVLSTDNKINSIGILSGSLTINLYSRANNVKILYNANVDHDTISTKSELKLNGETNGGITEVTTVYDTSFSLEYRYTMTGYTFIGWGSQDFDGVPRFTASDLTAAIPAPNRWNSASKWHQFSDYFSYLDRSTLTDVASTSGINDFDSYDFYVAGGYLITDTGFKTRGRGQAQNYNFYSAYANLFCRDLCSISNSSGGEIRDSSYTYETIELYGIWKANTYNVLLDLNDAGSSNGSTSAQFARYSGTQYVFDPKDYSGIVNPGDLRYKANENETNYQSVFVTFDTNDWYIIERSSVQGVFSYDNFNNTTIKKQSLMDYVIDRYGYTWLGWFSARIDNYRFNDNFSSETATPIWITRQYSEDMFAFPNLDLSTYEKLHASASEGSSIVKDNFTDYFYLNNDKSVYNRKYISKFVYKNQLGVFDNSNSVANKNTYIYFYTYGDSDKNSGDYLNGFARNYDSYFTYFDTAIDYMSYRKDISSDYEWFKDTSKLNYNSSASVFEKINNYRGITLFAYWRTNLYNVNVDYRDKTSTLRYPESKTGIGSTSVVYAPQDSSKTFASVFFDDDLESRLNMFIPARLGYDFIGWSFNPQISDGSSDLIEYNFVRATTYKLDRSNTNYLFTLNTTRDKLRSEHIEVLGDNDSDHVVYLFAGWTAQEFSINVSLNISAENLLNMYREDSEFTLGLYEDLLSSYTGIKRSFAMTLEEDGELKFVDIVANISFNITFDTKISEAVYRVNNVEYHLNDLFATSAGYYLLGWLYNPTSTSEYYVTNSLQSTFDEDGNLSNKLNVNGMIDGESTIVDALFDEEYYGKLYYSFYTDGINSAKTLSSLDFESVMNLRISETNGSQFDTFTSSTNKSTNFGIADSNYYLATEYTNGRYYLYYYDGYGAKQYVTPYIYWEDEDRYEIANVGSASNLTFDGTNFYYSGYVIYFENYRTYNAFYTVGNYGYNTENPSSSNLKRIRIQLVKRNNLLDDTVQGKTGVGYTPLKTRQITMYAHWLRKSDLTLSVTNGNNGNGISADTTRSNHGLAGFYDVWTTSNNGKTTQNRDGAGNYEDGIKIDAFNFYDDVNYVIYPFYNGRYLSEMRLAFYSYEDVGNEPSGFKTSYKKVKYELILNFGWDSLNHILTIETNNNRTRLERDGQLVYGISFVINELGDLIITGSDKFSNLDIYSFEGSFMKIYNYKPGETYSIPSYTRNSYFGERKDINAMTISMDKIKSSTEMVCSFSVQTFITEFYNVFDDSGASINSVGGSSSSQFTIDGMNSYADIFRAVNSARYANGTSSLGVSLGLGDVINLSTTSYIPTIQADCYDAMGQYNVPYGTLIYGNNYTPDRTDYIVNTLLADKFGGYEYIYEGSYNYGVTTMRMSSETCQFTRVLGDTSITESVRKPSNLYSFRTWYEAIDGAGSMIFDEYSETDEQTIINRNIILFGYYAANNKPTNIQFYTWGDSSNSYIEYTGNIDQYTLQSSKTSTSFIKSASTQIIPDELATVFVNNSSDNKAIIKYNVSFGYDGLQFGSDAYYSQYIENDTSSSNKQFVNNVLSRYYWYYRFQNYYLEFDRNGKHTVRYNPSNQRFYYLSTESNNSSTKNYINLYTRDLKSEDGSLYVYADLNPSSSGINITNEYEFDTYKSRLTQLTVRNDEYTYNYRGADLYAYINKTVGDASDERYYKIKEVKNYLNDNSLTSSDRSVLSNLMPNGTPGSKASAKFYVKINGTLYFLIIDNGSGTTKFPSASTLYKFSGGEFSEALELQQYGAYITTIDNYFFIMDEKLYQVNYPTSKDNGYDYINPWKTENKCNLDITVNGVKSNYTFYFDYAGKEFYQDKAFENRVTADKFPGYRKYTPVNENYSVEIDYNSASQKWEYKGVKIRSLPDPTIGLWYGYGEQSKQYYGYIGYINMLDSDINYLINETLSENDTSKQQGKDRIYDTLVKYIDRNFSGSNVTSLKEQARSYVRSYRNNKAYLANLITVSPSGFIYEENTNIITAVNVLLTCSLTLTIGGHEYTYYPTVKYQFNLITSDTSISENIYAIPIYCRNAIEFSSDSVQTTSGGVNIDMSKMTIQVFENIGNNFTHMYTKENGDYLRFIVLSESQYSEMIRNPDHPSGLANVISNYGLTPYKEEEVDPGGSGRISISLTGNGVFYIIAYYDKSGLTYPFRISDNTVCCTVDSGRVSVTLI